MCLDKFNSNYLIDVNLLSLVCELILVANVHAGKLAGKDFLSEIYWQIGKYIVQFLYG